MVIFGILAIVGTFASEANNVFSQYNYFHQDFGVSGLIYGIILLVLGLILIYIYKGKSGSSGDDLLIYGIVFIVIGFIGGTLGGLLAIIGGILLIVDFFL